MSHKPLLLWLLYVAVVVLFLAAMQVLGLPALVWAHDHSHLSLDLIVFWLLAEVMVGRELITLSRLHDQVAAHVHQALPRTAITDRDVAQFLGSNPRLSAHPAILLEGLSVRLYERAGIGAFFAARIVWLGIFGTVFGVILAFWPFLGMGADPHAMQAHIGDFFSGVAVAFIPTALSFVLKIALDVTHHLLDQTVTRIVTELAFQTARVP